jgi:hypothetical protein
MYRDENGVWDGLRWDGKHVSKDERIKEKPKPELPEQETKQRPRFVLSEFSLLHSRFGWLPRPPEFHGLFERSPFR